jgi:hypothetical protein
MKTTDSIFPLQRSGMLIENNRFHLLAPEERNVDGTSMTYTDCDPASVDEREAWLNLSIRGLGEAYGGNEPEYSADLIKKVNPDYAGVKSLSQHC